MTDEARTRVTINVNGRPVEADPGELLIEVAQRAGEYIPRFCYHPRMDPVGVCRMCLVEVEGPRGATLQPACYVHVNDGMSVTTNSEKVKKAQDGILEFLLANHPLDCPVCDKGGECPLQDQALAHGSGETRFIEEKRHFVKPVEIGALVLLDRERCIQCSRCTRFAADVAGDAQIAFAGRGDLIEVAPAPSEPFDSVFSGNTVQICPVGALTAKPYRFAARPWDLDQVASTCTTCSVGCRVAVQSSGNRLTRVLGVDADPVNHGWLCDKGRFTLDSVDGNEESFDLLSVRTRVREPMIRRAGELVAVTWDEALAEAARLLRDAADHDAVGVIGGAALTNEGAFAWERLARGVLRTDHVDAQYGDGLDAALLQVLPTATIDDAASARVLVTLTGDLREELPVLFLRLRAQRTKHRGALVEIGTGPSALRALANVTLTTRPGEVASVVEALASGVVPADALFDDDALSEARRLLGADGSGVVFVVGRANLAESPVFTEVAIRQLAERFPAATFLSTLRRANVYGALDMGLSPRLLPGRGYRADARGRDTLAQLEAMRRGEQRAVLLLGGCVLGNVLDVDGASDALAKANVVAVTGHGGRTLAYADVVLPAAVQHERNGTVTNLEGRVSAVVAKIAAPGSAWPDVAIAAELAEALGQSLGLSSIEQTAQTIEATLGYPTWRAMSDPTIDGVLVARDHATSARRAMDPMAFPGIRSADEVGLGAPTGATMVTPASRGDAPSGATLATLNPVAPAPVVTADAYGLRLHLARRLYDHGVAVQGSPALAALVEGARVRLHQVDFDRAGVHDGDEIVVRSARGGARVRVYRDDAVARGSAVMDFGARDENGLDVAASVVDADAPVTMVRLESR